MSRQIYIIATLFFAVVCDRPSLSQASITPVEYLAEQPKPQFKPGHQLPPLTRWAYGVSSNLNLALADDWGYALDLGTCSTNYLLAHLQMPSHPATGLLTWATNNPGRYKISVNMNRMFPTPLPAGFYCTNSSGQFVNSAGAPTETSDRQVCPEGPEDYWIATSEFWAESLRVLRSNTPIAVILNGGEYGMGVVGGASLAWWQDPRVIAATNGLTPQRYASLRKARELGYQTTAVRAAVPDRELYIYYATGTESFRTGPDWIMNWGWSSDVMVTNTDLPSFECYYYYPGVPGHDFASRPPGGSTGNLLDLYLNSVGWNYELGYKTNYSWVCGGWGVDTNRHANITRYTGFLKCLYTGGMVGAVAGYFESSHYNDAAFPPNTPPHWLQQIIALGRVHAQFSYLEDYLFDGELLPGPGRHWMSEDKPAYEFTNTVADATVRVLARKHNDRAEWLICAWAADGDARDVTVNIPDLGDVTVTARDSGSLYLATDANNPMLLDETGQHVFRRVGRAANLFMK
jgi:hypothetical protein